MKTIILVGAGNMGFSMLAGWLRTLDDTYRFAVVDPVAQSRCCELTNPDGTPIIAVADVAELDADLAPAAVIFATKPGGICDAVLRMRDRFLPDTVLISVAAGLKIDQIREASSFSSAVVRVMPNIGAMVGKSASAGIGSSDTTAMQRALVELLFTALGQFTWLNSEDDMHAVTAVSGSGPAYFFALCEAMIAAAMENGLDRDVAETLVHATCAAAGGLVDQTPNATLLRQQVTSPGGTTAAGLEALAENDGLQVVVARAIDAARKRSIEMS